MVKVTTFFFICFSLILYPPAVRSEEADAYEMTSGDFVVALNCESGSMRITHPKTGALVVHNESPTAVLLGHKERVLDSPEKCDRTSSSLRLRYDFKKTSGTLDSFDAALLKEVSVKDSRVDVTYTFEGTPRAEVIERFKDRGGEIYGGWEYSFGNDLDNRGLSEAFPAGYKRSWGTSARAPIFYFTSGFALYVPTYRPIGLAFGRNGSHRMQIEGQKAHYVLLLDNDLKTLMGRYNELAGPSRMPPLWAFGSFWWRNDATKKVDDRTTAQERVLYDASELDRRRIRATAMLIDRPYGTGTHGWGSFDFSSEFPEPKLLIDKLEASGLKTVLWVANRAAGKMWRQAVKKDLLFPGASRPNWPAIDLQKDTARDFFVHKLKMFADLGVTGFKIDRGDEGEMPREVENLHAELIPKAAAEALSQAHKDNFFLFSRSVFDQGRKYSAVWSGDPHGTFEGLQDSVRHALRSGLINFPFWGSDTGGFLQVPTPELFVRWAEFSAWCPFMEVLIERRRSVLWSDFPEETIKLVGEQANIHHDLIPYTRTYTYESSRTGVPIMRPLFLQYPNQADLRHIWDQYIYGESFLVAPVLKEGMRSREVTFPAGNRWYRFPDFQESFAPGINTIDAQLGDTPVFVKEGSIFVTGDLIQGNATWEQQWSPRLAVTVVHPVRGRASFPYFDGARVLPISARAADDKLMLTLPDLDAETEVRSVAAEKLIKRITVKDQRGTRVVVKQASNVSVKGRAEIVFEYKK